MKKSILFITIAIASIGLIAVGFIDKSDEPVKEIISVNQSNSSITTFESVFSGKEAFKVDQDLMYQVRGRYTCPVTKENLKRAETLDDIIPHHSSGWITEYSSVEISTTSNNQKVTAISSNDVLTIEQKSILNSVDASADILIKVKYKAENPVNSKIENQQIDVTMTIVPETEAEYSGGYDEMIKYLKENSYDNILGMNTKQFQLATIHFTVNERGKTESVHLTNSSGNNQVDKILVELINKMPKWKPAQNSNGERVKQDFQLDFGITGC